MTAKRSVRMNRTLSLWLIGLVYLLAAGLGGTVYLHGGGAPWLRLLVADVAATAFVWLCSLLVDNASVYDPYWSVAPIAILDLWVLGTGRFDVSSLALCLVVNLWGLRLTYNWVTTFQGLHVQDWRYDAIRERTGAFYPLANLFGIQLMPTLIVYACVLPTVLFLQQGGRIGPVGALGLAVSVAGLGLEAVADAQSRSFRKVAGDRSQLVRTGLWRHSRHPNYLGEILMWWGVDLVFLSAFPGQWRLGFGALVNTALFLFISIPMAEKRLATYKADYAAYRAETPMLLPFSFGRRDRG